MLPPLSAERTQELPAVDGCLYRTTRAVYRALCVAWRRCTGRFPFLKNSKNVALLP